jgi:autotransporter-associated beta strand protein
MKFWQISLLSASVGTSFAPCALAETYTWNLGTNGSWNTTSANWTGAGSVWVNGSANTAVFSGTAVLVTASQPITANKLTFDSSGYTINASGGSTITLAGAGAGITTNFSAGASVSISVGLAGTDGFTKSGVGRIVLNNASTYSGPTTISAGVIQIASGNDRLPIGTDLSISSGASLSIATGRSQQIAALSGAGTVTGAGSSAVSFTLNGSAGGATFTGALSNGGTGGLILTKNGTGTQTLGGSTTSNYFGGTSINAGTLIAAKNSAFGIGSVAVASGATWGVQGGIIQSNASTVAGTGAAGAAGALDNRSGSNTLSGAVTLSGPATLGATAGGLTLSGGINNAGHALTFNPTTGTQITVGTAGIGGSGGLIKNGDGTLTLSAANTFNGGTTVNAGSLVVNGSLASGGAVLVMAGSSLSGSGTINGPTGIASGGRLAPGNSPGVLSFGDFLTLNDGALTAFEIAGMTRGTQHDGIDVAGTLAYGGTLELTFTSSLLGTGTLDLFQFGTAPLGNFDAITGVGDHAGSFVFDGGTSLWTLVSGDQTLAFNPTTGDLSFAPSIPEPASSAVLLGLASLGLATRRRRTAKSV